MELLKNSNIQHEFRTTVIKEYHTIEDIEEMASLIGDSPYYLQKVC